MLATEREPWLSQGLSYDVFPSSLILGSNFKSHSQKRDTRSLEQSEKLTAPDLVTGLSSLPSLWKGLCEPSDREGAGS